MESSIQQYRIRRKKRFGYLLDIALVALFVAVVVMLIY
jgi:hypothetical protein